MRFPTVLAASGLVLLVLAAAVPAIEPANGSSTFAAISADGRYVAFESSASNLVAGDGNLVADVFVRDRVARSTERVSVGAQGLEGNGTSVSPAISADGRYVAFTSGASNLVPGDTNNRLDVFVHDRVTGTTELVSTGLGGTQTNDESGNPSISGDGRFVAFLSYASNLVPGDVAGTWDVFVRDRATGTTERINVSSDEAPATGGRRIYTKATISAGGRFVAFSSDAPDLVSGDTNGTPDVFIRDRVAGTTERVSVGSGGWQLPGDAGIYGTAISADGRYVSFVSNAPDVVAGDTNGSPDLFLRDRVAATTERISVASDGSQGNDASWDLQAISADGRYVAFTSFATNLVFGDTNGRSDVFLRDRATGTTERISVGDAGEANDQSGVPGLNADGSVVLFQSPASNLAAGDTNGTGDVFVRDRSVGRTELISVARDPQPAGAGLTLSPRPPRAGKLLTVTMRVTAAGHPVTEATIGGTARVRGRNVPLVRRTFVDSAARFVWRLPKSAKKRRLTVSITVATVGGSVTGTFTAIVR